MLREKFENKSEILERLEIAKAVWNSKRPIRTDPAIREGCWILDVDRSTLPSDPLEALNALLKQPTPMCRLLEKPRFTNIELYDARKKDERRNKWSSHAYRVVTRLEVNAKKKKAPCSAKKALLDLYRAMDWSLDHGTLTKGRPFIDFTGDNSGWYESWRDALYRGIWEVEYALKRAGILKENP